MKAISMQVNRADWQALTIKAQQNNMSQSALFRVLAAHVLSCPRAPRTKEKPKDFLWRSVSVPNLEEKLWRARCGLKFRLWLCECVLPAVHENVANLNQEVLERMPLTSLPTIPEKIEIGCDGPWIKLKVKPAWKLAADGQWDATVVWARKVLDQAAPYFIANPRIFEA